MTDVIGSTTRVTSYVFDLDNRTTSITTPEGTVNYVYDSATGFHKETYTANSDIVYAPDPLQRLQTVTVNKQNGVTLGTPLVTTYYYTAVGNIDHITYPNGTETDYGYDTLNRLTSVTNKKGSSVLSSYTYTLENDGLRTGVTEKQLESDGTTSTVTKTWTYDALQRLTQEAVTSSISANSYTDTYTMDLVGNRLTKTHTQGGQTLTVNYTYNNNDQLTSESGSGSSTYSTSYGYDANGSLTSISRTGSGAETDTYGYDLQNRLSGATITRTENGLSRSRSTTSLPGAATLLSSGWARRSHPSFKEPKHMVRQGAWLAGSCVLAWALFLPGDGATAERRGDRLTIHWEKNFLRLRGDKVPGGEIEINYLEAYCRPGSSDRDWRETVIGHTTKKISALEDGSVIRLKDTLDDGVVVEHRTWYMGRANGAAVVSPSSLPFSCPT